MLGFLPVAVATPETWKGTGTGGQNRRHTRWVGEQMTLVSGVFPRFPCSLVIVLPLPSRPHRTSLTFLPTLHLGSIAYPFASRKLRTLCYSLGHIIGPFRPVFCCQE